MRIVLSMRPACFLRNRWIAACLVLLPAAASAAPAGGETWREARPLMGTLVELQLEGAELPVLKRAAAASYREMARLAGMMSRYDAKSVVSEINRQAGIAPVAAPAELLEVLKMARRVSEASAGAFDVTIGALSAWRFGTAQSREPPPATIARQRALVDYREVRIDAARGSVLLERRGMRLDLGGIAKLYILHAGMRVLREQGVESAMINGGGDIEVMSGKRARPWRIGIRHPRRERALLGTIELREGFVASSGDYERYFEQDGRRNHHVLDPRTGRPTADLAHVTLVGPSFERINGYSAAVMVLGYERGRALIERMPDVEAILVPANGSWWATPRLSNQLTKQAIDR